MTRISPDIESLIHKLNRAWRFEYQDPDACGGFIEKITPAEYKSIVDGLGMLSAGLAQYSKEEEFCYWLKGYLRALPGRDELEASEGNTIRNKLNETLGGAALADTSTVGNSK